MKFRKKAVVIEAVRNLRENREEMVAFTVPAVVLQTPADPPGVFYIGTLEGRMRVDIGDWVIKGVKGEFYPCKPDIFAETYELVGES